jgi:hypothetical protein
LQPVTIDDYLTELGSHLRAGPLAKRRILREIEAHLLEAAERGGESAAVAAFGPPAELAARFDQAGNSGRTWAFVGRVFVPAALAVAALGGVLYIGAITGAALKAGARGIPTAEKAPPDLPRLSLPLPINSKITCRSTSSTGANWTVTFSESVTGVDANDFSVTTSGVTGTVTITGTASSGVVIADDTTGQSTCG